LIKKIIEKTNKHGRRRSEKGGMSAPETAGAPYLEKHDSGVKNRYTHEGSQKFSHAGRLSIAACPEKKYLAKQSIRIGAGSQRRLRGRGKGTGGRGGIQVQANRPHVPTTIAAKQTA